MWTWTKRILYYGLAALGAYILIGMGIQSLQRGEVGIGVAFLVYLVYTAITKGHDYLTGRPRPESPDSPAPSSSSPQRN